MILQMGSRGPEVLALQNQLIGSGYKLTADGQYGSQTKDVVMEFQADNHLLQDGVFGPDTQSVIDAESSSTEVRGIDVSYAQRVIDWDAVKAGGKVSFAILKCTDGATIQDSRFSSNLSEVKRLGITYGAYHFFRFFTSDPLSQANNLKATAKPADFGPGSFPICIDVEYQDVNGITNPQVSANSAACAAKLRTFVDLILQYYGRPPIIYTSYDFWNRVLKAPDGFQHLKLWVCDPNSSQGPLLPSGWTDYQIWQRAATPSISGISSLVDINVMRGSIDPLIA